MTNIKNPIQYLRDTGLLFEINRQVLHPYGLALAVTPTDADSESEDGLFSLIDSREDKEGFVYSPQSFVNGLEKSLKFAEEFGVQKLNERYEELGFLFQEHPDPHMKKNGVDLLTYNPDYDADKEDSMDLVAFKVPYEWLASAALDWFGLTVSELLDEYTYDTTEPLYAKAKQEGVIIREDFMRDAN